MAQVKNRQILLRSRPTGKPTTENFERVEHPVPEPGDGQVLLRTLYLSLDPYMRGRMSDARSYAKPAELGQPMVGGTVSKVVASPMPGMTAYVGLLEIGQPKPGETVVVAAASGAVGSAVGQIAKIKGARAVGVAGGAAKCRFVVEELGFDACIDHRAPDLAAQLAAACPKGVDVYFENVGGAVQQAVWPLLNEFARVPVCGVIAQYSATAPSPGPDIATILRKRLLVRGFIVWDFAAREGDFLRDIAAWVREGKLKYREDIVEGLEKAPEAFLGLLEGKNFGKLVVKVAPP